MTLIGRVVRFGKYYGWTELLRRILISSTGWLIEKKNVAILMVRPEDIAFHDAVPEFKEITRSDIDEIFKVMYFSREHVLNRFDRGERCFAILEKGNIVTYLWAAFKERSMKELSLNVQLKTNQSWFYNALTIKEARGKGYYPSIIRCMAKTLQNEGISEIFIDVEGENAASIRGVEKAGFKKVLRVQMKKTLSRIKYWVTVFDNPVWLRLSEEIEYPQGGTSIHEVIIHGS
jgi:predicted acetyltransferase